MHQLLSDYQGNKIKWILKENLAKKQFFYLRHKSKNLKNLPEVFKLEAISIRATRDRTHLQTVSVRDRIANLTDNTGPLFVDVHQYTYTLSFFTVMQENGDTAPLNDDDEG